MDRMSQRAMALAVSIVLAGCSSYQADRLSTATHIAEPAGLTLSWVKGGDFTLAAFTRLTDPARSIVIYIEGDGLAWLTRTRLSTDPTPRSPMGLKLAALDGGPNVVYLARPCQYTGVGINPRCGPALWSDARFSGEVIEAMNRAIDAVVPSDHGGLELVGYSGGAAVAVLMAARRQDVVSIRTVAGNLDSVAVNELHGVSPMPASLNPADVAPALAALPQVHYVGEDDTVVPPVIAQGYAAKAGDRRCIVIHVVPGITHSEGWTRIWPKTMDDPPRCR